MVMLIFISILFLLFGIGAILRTFNPTRIYLIRLFKLYRMIDRYRWVVNPSINQVDNTIMKLIRYRGMSHHVEVRNGFSVTYMPVGVACNRRIMPFSYIEIYDGDTDVTACIGYDKTNKREFQVKYSDDAVRLMYLRSRRNGNKLVEFNSDNVGMIIENYCDFLLKNIM